MGEVIASDHIVTSIEALEKLYGAPSEGAIRKEIDHVNADYGTMIAMSPFFTIASVGPEGLDCSPRGDAPGFVRVHDEKTLMIPDRPGNNRIDSLRNIVRDPRVAVLFLIPGVAETLRVNGRATITADPALRESFAVNGKPARAVIVVAVERVYFQCAKALMRSKLWEPESRIERSRVPSAGQIISNITNGKFDGAKVDREMPARLKETLY